MAKEVSKESVETHKDKIGYKKETNGLENEERVNALCQFGGRA